MKKIVFVMTLLLAAVLAAGALAETVILPVQRAEEEGLAFPREKVLLKTNVLYMEHYGVQKIEGCRTKAGSVLLPDGRTAWISFLEREDDDAPGNLYLVLSADDGEVIEEYWPDDDIYTWILLQWHDIKGGSMMDWPLEDQALFTWLFGTVDEYFDPTQTAVSPETAIGIADAWLKERFGSAYDNALVSFSGRYDENGRLLHYWIVSFLRDGEQAFIVNVDTETGEVINSYDMAEGNG